MEGVTLPAPLGLAITAAGPFGLAVLVTYYLVRLFLAGDIISRRQYESNVVEIKQRSTDYAERLKESQVREAEWKAEARQSLAAAQQSASEHKAILEDLNEAKAALLRVEQGQRPQGTSTGTGR